MASKGRNQRSSPVKVVSAGGAAGDSSAAGGGPLDDVRPAALQVALCTGSAQAVVTAQGEWLPGWWALRVPHCSCVCADKLQAEYHVEACNSAQLPSPVPGSTPQLAFVLPSYKHLQTCQRVAHWMM